MPSPDLEMPRWAWWLLAALTALLLLPWALALYARWWALAWGERTGELIEFLMPRMG